MMIMKKKYNSPKANLVQLETEPMMIITSGEQDNVNVGDKPVGGKTPDLSGGRRGEWGNLW